MKTDSNEADDIQFETKLQTASGIDEKYVPEVTLTEDELANELYCITFISKVSGENNIFNCLVAAKNEEIAKSIFFTEHIVKTCQYHVATYFDAMEGEPTSIEDFFDRMNEWSHGKLDLECTVVSIADVVNSKGNEDKVAQLVFRGLRKKRAFLPKDPSAATSKGDDEEEEDDDISQADIDFVASDKDESELEHESEDELDKNERILANLEKSKKLPKRKAAIKARKTRTKTVSDDEYDSEEDGDYNSSGTSSDEEEEAESNGNEDQDSVEESKKKHKKAKRIKKKAKQENSKKTEIVEISDSEAESKPEKQNKVNGSKPYNCAINSFFD